MIYEFYCEECGLIEEISAPIKDGPPKEVSCTLCVELENKQVLMNQEFGGNFILKGTNWPSKDMKSGQYAEAVVRERNDHELSEDSRNQRIVDEVMSVRRKGTKAVEDLKNRNPQKFNDYKKAVKEGYRAKGKSYRANI